MIEVKVDARGRDLSVGDHTTLFHIVSNSDTNQAFRVSRDGQRFLVNAGPRDPSQPFTVVINWPTLVAGR